MANTANHTKNPNANVPACTDGMSAQEVFGATALARQLAEDEAARMVRGQLATESLLYFVGEIMADLTENGTISTDFDFDGHIKSVRVSTPTINLYYNPILPKSSNTNNKQ
ncbi:hypothetical protein FWF89_01530 [Candidatus Saccharibacteria bacterium]|nr:hypothetical protein [Candidatus Saccharibacteria bacterium]